jgi:hypothetical protein
MIGIRAFLFFGCFLLLPSPTACTRLLCRETTLNEVVSGDGNSVARILERDCGATTSVATIVQVFKRRVWRGIESPEEVLVLGSRQLVQVRWVQNATLEVSMSAEAATEAYHQHFQAGGVEIKYVQGNGRVRP